MLLHIALVTAVTLVARVSQATPIAYDESVSGDLGTALPYTQFTLDVGANTVSGTTAFARNGTADFDEFAIDIPAGMHLAGVTYAFHTTVDGSLTQANANYGLKPSNVFPFEPFLASATIDFLGGTVHPFGAALPLGPGVFTAGETSLAKNGDGGWTTDYTWTFDVVSDGPSAVPEPASMCLLGTGLVGSWLRRRRSNR